MIWTDMLMALWCYSFVHNYRFGYELIMLSFYSLTPNGLLIIIEAYTYIKSIHT